MLSLLLGIGIVALPLVPQRYRQGLLDFLLMNAAVMGNGDAVRKLLSRGADPNARDRMPMIVETLDEQGNAVSIRPARQHLSTVLMGAAIAGHANVIELLVEHGAEVDARNAYDQTALMQAVVMEQGEAVRALLAAGAEVNARDAEGRTALGWAKHLEKHHMVSLLETVGCTE